LNRAAAVKNVLVKRYGFEVRRLITSGLANRSEETVTIPWKGGLAIGVWSWQGSREGHMKKLKSGIELFFGLAFLALMAMLMMGRVTAKFAGIPVQGEVIGKREAIEMGRGDDSNHTFRIRYRYRPWNSPSWESGEDEVDAETFRRLQNGSALRIRYSPLAGFRGLGGSVIAESRSLGPALDNRFFVELVGFALAALLGWLAYRTKSRGLAFVAGFLGCTWAAGVVVMGFILFPMLFLAWTSHRGKGYGWLLLSTMAASSGLLYWRIPWPEPLLPGPVREVTGTVRHVRTVSEIWSTDEGGQSLRDPFQMVDIEFTPDGGKEPIHVEDRVDLGSVADLRDGGAVQVVYLISNPDAAHIARGTRNYGWNAFVYLMVVTYGGGLATLLLLLVVVWVGSRISARFAKLRATLAEATGDPRRRERVETLLRALDKESPRR
jgi:hypothetical protein